MACTPEEKALIESNAFASQMSVSDYLLKLGTGRQINSRSDNHAIDSLRRFADLLRDVYFNGKPANDARVLECFNQIVEAAYQLVGRKKRGEK